MWRGISIPCLILFAITDPGLAEEQSPGAARTDAQPIAEFEQAVSRLQSRLDYPIGPSVTSGPVIVPSPGLGPASACTPATNGATPFTHGVVYDDGWTLRPIDPQSTPYELTIGLHNQFRYTGFASEEPFVVNSAGQRVPTPERNDFDINRGRLVFSGYAIDPRLEFYANVDYNTVGDQQIQMLMSWIRYAFDPSFNLSFGLGKVPGTWEWLESSRFTLGAERTLATTFFRPSMTAGIWIDGEIAEDVHYRALVGDGFNTFTLNSSEQDANLAYSGMLWWEPLGDFGIGFSDLEDHAEPVVRVGHAFTFSRQDADPTGEPGPEQTVIRLSDGTRLVDPGALSPGVTVNNFDLALYAVHAGLKHRGFSLSGEYFLRRLDQIRGNGPIPDDGLSDYGFFVQSGLFVLPREVELYGRGSAVFGPFGNGTEIGGGVNWYVRETRNWRFTLDVAQIDDSPTQQDRTGFVAGASGLLVRLQCWTYF